MAGALEANKTPRERQEARASHMGFWGLSRRGPLLAAHEKRGNDLPQIRGAVQLGGVDGALHEPAGGKQWVEHALGPGWRTRTWTRRRFASRRLARPLVWEYVP